MKHFLSLVILSLCFLSLQAQLNNEYLFNRIRPADSLTSDLRLDFYNFNFARNYEYSNKFHDGYTLFGSQFEPRLVYYPNANFVLSVGTYIRKDYGTKGVYDAQPVFTATYQKNNLSLNFGTLEGNIQHQYIEPLYDFENKVSQPLQYGTQLIVVKEKFRLDSWLAWQKMIYPGDAAKEQIVGGFTSDLSLLKNENWHLSIPFQTYMYHAGGQIDVLKNIPIMTLFNGALGFKLSRNISYKLKQIYTDNYFVGYKDFSPSKTKPFSSGTGLWLNTGLDTRFGNFALSYWHGDDFLSIKGMPLYNSFSQTMNDYGFVEKQRDILMFRYAFQKELVPNLYLDVRFEPHFDLNSKDKSLQFNHSFFLTYKENIRLTKVQRGK